LLRARKKKDEELFEQISKRGVAGRIFMGIIRADVEEGGMKELRGSAEQCLVNLGGMAAIVL
jgi:hypothetical protein